MDIITHSTHPHSLTLQHIQMPYYCCGCKEIGFGSCYQCKTNECNFYLHIECATAGCFEVSHPFSDSCKFTFLEEGSSRKGSLCDACGRKVKGFRYKCACTFRKRNLHPHCTQYKDKYEVNGWTLKLSKKIPSICLHCEDKDEVKGWGYASSCGDYCFHNTCLWEVVYEEWNKGTFSGLTDVSQMISLSVVKLVSKQVQVERRKNISSRIKISTGDVITIAANVTSAVSNN